MGGKSKNATSSWRSFQEVVAVIVAQHYSDATVEVGKWVVGPDGRRELDVLIENAKSRALIECKFYSRKVGIDAIDALRSKSSDLNISDVYVASSSGFTRPALTKAVRVGIKCITVRGSKVPNDIVFKGGMLNAGMHYIPICEFIFDELVIKSDAEAVFDTQKIGSINIDSDKIDGLSIADFASKSLILATNSKDLFEKESETFYAAEMYFNDYKAIVTNRGAFYCTSLIFRFRIQRYFVEQVPIVNAERLYDEHGSSMTCLAIGHNNHVFDRSKWNRVPFKGRSPVFAINRSGKFKTLIVKFGNSIVGLNVCEAENPAIELFPTVILEEVLLKGISRPSPFEYNKFGFTSNTL